jgi:hypothetical protein
VSVLLFLFSSPSSLLLFPSAIGKKISDQKKVFSFFVLSFFPYRVNIKNQNNIVTEKEDKKFPLVCLPYCLLSCFFGKKTKPRTMADARKGSQIGAGQGREERAISLPLCW